MDIYASNLFHCGLFRPYFCEYDSGTPTGRPYRDLEFADVLAASEVLGYSNGPQVSWSSCLAYCQGKGAKTIFLNPSRCSCLSGTLAEVGATEDKLVADCQGDLPCSGIPAQVCGCREGDDERPLLADIQGMSEDLYGFESCEDLRRHGVFINGKYKLKGQDELQQCDLWGL